MQYRYLLCDVFSGKPFAGNQLAVFPDATGLTDDQMQAIAREFNFSETTFVFLPRAGNTRHVRIFTPTIEVPFAGHPNIGTAYALAMDGAFGAFGESTTVVFEEDAGLVPISIHRQSEQGLWCELEAPQCLTVGPELSPDRMAVVLSLDPDDIVTNHHLPVVASVGLPFLFTEIRSRAALERIDVNIRELTRLRDEGVCPDLHVYTRVDDEFDLQARVFVPLDGVPEDPATGSANCALAALLADRQLAPHGAFNWRIVQGVEMGRTSVLDARAEKQSGSPTRAWIGGLSALVGDGTLRVD